MWRGPNMSGPMLTMSPAIVEVIDLSGSPDRPNVPSNGDSHVPERVLNGKRTRRADVKQGGSSSSRASRDHSRERAKPGVPNGKRHGRERRSKSDITRESSPTTERNETRQDRDSPRQKDQSRRSTRAHSPNERVVHDSAPSTSQHDSHLFFVDVAPAEVTPHVDGPSYRAAGSSISGATLGIAENVPPLLLPSHVSISGGAEVESLPPLNADTETQDDYIEYIDYDDFKAVGLVRYFDEVSEEPKATRLVCKNCGGDHKTFDCTIQICLTCGARDEHSTRGCPISKTCFRCGMKGHINLNCPNRYAREPLYDECDRCGSSIHKNNECPTLWRMYEYVASEEQQVVLSSRREKSELTIGTGGEGYIAEDEWCYNCGQRGHWGDDCPQPHQAERLREPSAFSAYNTMSGPFFDPAEDRLSFSSRPRKRSDWEQEDTLPDGWGVDAPIDVGKRGKNKERERLQKQARALDDDDGDDDWFGRTAQGHSRHPNSTSAPTQGGKKPGFGFSFKSDIRPTETSNLPPRPTGSGRPTLLDRISPDDVRKDRPAARWRDYDRNRSNHRRDAEHDSRSSRRSYNDERRDRGADSRRREEPGPRYRGGYSR